jgi:hypothetical protein
MFGPYCPFCSNQADLTQLSCPDSSAPAVLILLSCSCCPILAILPSLPCPSCHSSPLHPVQGDRSRQICQADRSRLTCPGCPSQAVLSRLLCPDCPTTVVLSSYPILPRLSCLVILSQLSNPAMFFPSCPLLSRQSCDYRCPYCPLQLFCPRCRVPAVLSRLSFSGCPVPSVLVCPYMTVLECYQ